MNAQSEVLKNYNRARGLHRSKRVSNAIEISCPVSLPSVFVRFKRWILHSGVPSISIARAQESSGPTTPLFSLLPLLSSTCPQTQMIQQQRQSIRHSFSRCPI